MSFEKNMGCFISSGIVVALVALGGAYASMTSVEEGHRGVKTRFGRVVSDEALQPGLHFKLPFVEKIHPINVRAQLISDTIKTASKDTQEVVTKYDVNFDIDPNKVVDIYKTIGMDYASIKVKPAIKNTIHTVIGQTAAAELSQKKAEINGDVEKLLEKELKPLGFDVTLVSVADSELSRDFQESIERKEIANQAAIAATYKTKQTIEEAKQAEEKARGEANALKLRAEADAAAIKMRAEAASSNPQALEFEALKQWNGQLPLVVGSNENILDVSGLLTKGLQKVNKMTPVQQNALKEKMENQR